MTAAAAGGAGPGGPGTGVAPGAGLAGIRALVLAGGLSHERDVSLRSGRRVADALKATGVDVEVLDADARLLDRVGDFDACLIALHGGAGEDGALREVLELAGLPYVGSEPDACRLAWDKPTTKSLLRRAGLRTPDAAVLPHDAFRELGAPAVLAAVEKRLGVPLMVKPARGGSALGCTKVEAVEALPSAMVACFSYGEAALVEQFVTGVEVAVTVLEGPEGPYALPAVEIRPLSGVYDYAARYTAGATEFFTPARLGDAARVSVGEAAVAAHVALGLRDLSRVDAIVSPEGEVWVLEVNVSPGMTETSLLPMAVEAAGLRLGEVLADLLGRAVSRVA